MVTLAGKTLPLLLIMIDISFNFSYNDWNNRQARKDVQLRSYSLALIMRRKDNWLHVSSSLTAAHQTKLIKMKKLEELKKGDRIKIEYGWDVLSAKVIRNDPYNKRLVLIVRVTPFDRLVGRTKQVFEYGSYNLKNFNLLNNA